MIKSSSHSKNWDMEFIYFDTDNLNNPDCIDNVILWIDGFDDEGGFYLESTAKTFDGMWKWNDEDFQYWKIDV